MGRHVETVTDGKVLAIYVSVRKYQKNTKKDTMAQASIKDDLKQTGSNVHCVSEKTGHFVISSYLRFDSSESHENFQKYIGSVACCAHGINGCDSLTIF